MRQFELSDNDRRPGGDDTAQDQNNDTGDDTKGVEHPWDTQNTETDLSLGEKDGGTLPADSSVVGSIFRDVTKDGIVCDIVGSEDATLVRRDEVGLLVNVAELQIGGSGR